MSQKLKPRLGSAIASTILSYAAVSFVGVDQAQATVLTYNFQLKNGEASGFFKLNNSSLTGIGIEEIAVSEGRLDVTFHSPPTQAATGRGMEGDNIPLRPRAITWAM